VINVVLVTKLAASGSGEGSAELDAYSPVDCSSDVCAVIVDGIQVTPTASTDGSGSLEAVPVALVTVETDVEVVSAVRVLLAVNAGCSPL